MDTDIEKAVAYLHDVLEDTSVTMDELRNMFPNEIILKLKRPVIWRPDI